jgi:hypothetical protein
MDGDSFVPIWTVANFNQVSKLKSIFCFKIDIDTIDLTHFVQFSKDKKDDQRY